MRIATVLIVTVVLTAYVSAAAAQTQTRSVAIYRCGADGRELRDSPCPNTLSASAAQLAFDQPSIGQARASKDNAAADAKRADAMEQERLKQEAQALRRNRGVAGIDGLKPIGAAPAASAAKSPKPPKAPKTPKSPSKPPKLIKPAADAG
jgi:hypothetical protein